MEKARSVKVQFQFFSFWFVQRKEFRLASVEVGSFIWRYEMTERGNFDWKRRRGAVFHRLFLRRADVKITVEGEANSS